MRSAGGVGRRILFESRDLRATLVAGASRRLLVVTFSSYVKQRSLDRPGFGEDFLADEGLAAIHVVARLNRWFQHRELPALIAAIRAEAAGYDRVIAYGSSMGGFAGLAYGADCGADTAIAFSPQVSLARGVAPFETRWRAEARAIRRWHPPRARLARQIIVFDPRHAIDARHARALAARTPTVLIEVPHGGHPAGVALAQADLLKPLFRDVAAGTLDPARYARLLRAARGGGAQYLYTVARRLGAHHGAAKLALAERALAIHPAPHNHALVAACSTALGRHEAADAAYRAALAAGPDDADTLAAYAGFLAMRGDPARAAALVARAARISGGSAALRRLAWRLAAARVWVSAKAVLRGRRS